MFCASFAIVPGDQEILLFHIYLSPVAYLSFKNLEWEWGGVSITVKSHNCKGCNYAVSYSWLRSIKLAHFSSDSWLMCIS